MGSPWEIHGLFRIKGAPNMVQVQLGPFSRPIAEKEYLNREMQPALSDLPWQSEPRGLGGQEGKNSASEHCGGVSR